MTGIMDNEITNGACGVADLRQVLNTLRSNAEVVNKKVAEQIGINPASAITCVKPSGNTSQLADCASGIHARHSKYYSRLATLSRTDPLAKYMITEKFPYEDHIKDPTAILFKFPVKSPDGCVVSADRSAVEQLSFWLVYKLEYCDHNPSVTITVKPGEWCSVIAWVWKNFDNVSGVTFIADHDYQQPPYQECDKEAYEKLLATMPEKFDQEAFSKFETEDNTEVSQTLACGAGGCEI
jgi:ribonucleoside-diphosphate reductase alpha chain